jgi:hypothetical protein
VLTELRLLAIGLRLRGWRENLSGVGLAVRFGCDLTLCNEGDWLDVLSARMTFLESENGDDWGAS